MTIRVFVSGQSNALGRNTGGPDWAGIHANVRVWNNVNPLGGNGSAFTTPATARAAGTFENTDRNSFGVWFCDRLARETGDSVDMTIVARGASSILVWDPAEATYPMLQECIDVWTATGQPPAHVFLWHQGEGDAASMDHAEWETRFLDLCADLAAAGVIDGDTIILLGGIADETLLTKVQFNAEVLRPLAAAQPRFGYANPRGLDTSDGTHFDGPALYNFGFHRYYAAYLDAQAGGSIYALVNQGGTPGSAGSGSNKSLDLTATVREGYRLRGGPKYLTIDQTYERDPEVKAFAVEVLGGGGGGGGAIGNDGVPRASPGGGAGGYAMAFIESPAASYAVTIGAAGTGGAADTSGAAGTGGTTTFGGFITAAGGVGGFASSSASSPVIGGGGAGGSATGGDFNMAGDSGDESIKLAATSRKSGRGGGTKYGSGGRARAASSTSGSAGVAATGYGAGGGGSTSSDTVGQPGGAGAPGVVVLWEYIR